MAKIRVYELAKKIGYTVEGYYRVSRAENGMEVKSQSGLDDAQTAMITKKFGKQEPAQGESGAREGFR